MDTAVEKYETLDILVNNAGVMDNMISAAELTDAIWEKVLSTNK